MADSNTFRQHKRGSVTFEVDGSKAEDIQRDTTVSEEASVGIKQKDGTPGEVQGNPARSM